MGHLCGIHLEIQREVLDPLSGVSDHDFFSLFRNRLTEPYAMMLLSGGNLDCSRFSLALFHPLTIFKVKGQSVFVKGILGESCFEDDPLKAMDMFLSCFKPDYPLDNLPFCGGAVGYFSYELKNVIERLPQTAEDDLHLPDILLVVHSEIAILDRQRGILFQYRLHPRCHKDGDFRASSKPSTSKMTHRLTEETIGPLSSNFTHQAYLEAVSRIRQYILEGDVYQVNLSQRFSFPFRGDPRSLWFRLFSKNPAPFYAYVHGGDHWILSTSMERFLFRNGTYVETRPIKGTRNRGHDAEHDQQLREDLISSTKDDAELSMIVDLLRNDLGRICVPRSVKVLQHKRVEAYENVFHLVSLVAGRLRGNTSPGSILKATFPGGSITGCPKIRAMEIIDELEPFVRHVYTGSIGYVGWHDNMDLNIAIRTGILHDEVLHFAVGGGVVFDSDEEAEYQETLHKGRTLLEVIQKW